jgi:hypothetical protein
MTHPDVDGRVVGVLEVRPDGTRGDGVLRLDDPLVPAWLRNPKLDWGVYDAETRQRVEP